MRALEFAVSYGVGTLGRRVPVFWGLCAHLEAEAQLAFVRDNAAAIRWARSAPAPAVNPVPTSWDSTAVRRGS